MFNWNNEKYTKDKNISYHKIKRNNKSLDKQNNYSFINGKSAHRAIYEQHYGVLLNPDTQIHHIDGRFENNNPINLIVVSHKEHGLLHQILWLQRRKLRKGVEMLQLIHENSPKIYKKENKVFYVFEYSYYYGDDKLDKTYSNCAFANNIEQLEHLVKCSGLYWNEELYSKNQ